MIFLDIMAVLRLRRVQKVNGLDSKYRDKAIAFTKPRIEPIILKE